MMGKRGCRSKKHLGKKRGVVILRLSRYTGEDIKRIENEFENIEWRSVDKLPEFKNVKFVSIFVEDLILGKAQCQMVNGKKVYVKPHYRKERNPRRGINEKTEILKNMVIAWLSEKSYLKSQSETQHKEG